MPFYLTSSGSHVLILCPHSDLLIMKCAICFFGARFAAVRDVSLR